jgi:CIC family chloride channel protein
VPIDPEENQTGGKKTSLLETALRVRFWIQRGTHFSDAHWMLFWAAAIGVCGALATVVFRSGIGIVEVGWSGNGHGLVALAESLPWPVRLIAPAIGGVLAGVCLLFAGSPRNAAQDYMEAIAIGDGRIDIRSSLARSTSSLITIASGGSIGREGSMVQLAATVASLLGRVRHFDPARLRLLVACGAAAGITAAYSAPIAGAFFVSEIVLGAVSMQSFGPLIVAAVAANITMREFAGYGAPYQMPQFPVIGAAQMPLFVLLGVLAGGFAPQFLRLLAFSREKMNALQWPLPVRLGAGGLLVGFISIGVPEVWGNGYSVVNRILHEPLAWSTVLTFLICKILATAATTGSGGIGGVFTPTLFVGAASGYLFGSGVHVLWPGLNAPPFAYAMVGMGAFLAAATAAPLMAILMVFEMTLSYPVMLPLSLASTLAYFVANATRSTPMYAVTARREAALRERDRLRGQTMRDLLQPVQTILPADATLADAARLMARFPVKYVYLVDSQGGFLGAVGLGSVATAMLEHADLADRRARDYLAEAFPTLALDTSLESALSQFVAHPLERVPVLDGPGSSRLVGVVYKSSVLDSYARLSLG